ncbi:hypothetical protein CPT_Mangalyan_174 [Escherichia phage Mangalyan]|nr:hypothetical protein CPT_Mangalyan_174 [Escherichia phage Mangalyan]
MLHYVQFWKEKRVKMALLPHNEKLCNSYFICMFVQCVGLMARQLFHLPGRAVYGRGKSRQKERGLSPLIIQLKNYNDSYISKIRFARSLR